MLDPVSVQRFVCTSQIFKKLGDHAIIWKMQVSLIEKPSSTATRFVDTTAEKEAEKRFDWKKQAIEQYLLKQTKRCCICYSSCQNSIDVHWKLRLCTGCIGTESVVQSVACDRGLLTASEVKQLPFSIRSGRIWEAHYFLKRHVDRLALKKFGSMENLLVEKQKRVDNRLKGQNAKVERQKIRRIKIDNALRFVGFGKLIFFWMLPTRIHHFCVLCEQTLSMGILQIIVSLALVIRRQVCWNSSTLTSTPSR
jgi:hypothetical protein